MEYWLPFLSYSKMCSWFYTSFHPKNQNLCVNSLAVQFEMKLTREFTMWMFGRTEKCVWIGCVAIIFQVERVCLENQHLKSWFYTWAWRLTSGTSGDNYFSHRDQFLIYPTLFWCLLVIFLWNKTKQRQVESKKVVLVQSSKWSCLP